MLYFSAGNYLLRPGYRRDESGRASLAQTFVGRLPGWSEAVQARTGGRCHREGPLGNAVRHHVGAEPVPYHRAVRSCRGQLHCQANRPAHRPGREETVADDPGQEVQRNSRPGSWRADRVRGNSGGQNLRHGPGDDTAHGKGGRHVVPESQETDVSNCIGRETLGSISI